jgi:hypothetical protein
VSNIRNKLQRALKRIAQALISRADSRKNQTTSTAMAQPVADLAHIADVGQRKSTSKSTLVVKPSL